jgi:hypothetical protein
LYLSVICIYKQRYKILQSLKDRKNCVAWLSYFKLICIFQSNWLHFINDSSSISCKYSTC